MDEIWKSIPEYENIYEVSNLGRVRTAEGKTTESMRHGTRVWNQRILKQKTDKGGYKRVTLWKNKSGKDFLVHRLVGFAFIPRIKSKEFINHKDGNPSNNYVENLEWCNSLENSRHAFINRLVKTPDPVVLLNLNTGEPKYFYSKAEASRFLGRNSGYVSGLLKQKKSEVDNYEIFVKGGNSR
ncbi:NUMOD4 motif-containing HNH endonuclease [uncultured Enterococcus sp.]|uniref:NUMOD4 motif-containing HNH endonuclease n=1 Tax=uncultured Enterococcus sp. TaxID=167972 RepID=UPI0025958ED4|nr:NUMOD4 motif-containing HNH endonuclease [uncultured Enterococcus sp.]